MKQYKRLNSANNLPFLPLRAPTEKYVSEPWITLAHAQPKIDESCWCLMDHHVNWKSNRQSFGEKKFLKLNRNHVLEYPQTSPVAVSESNMSGSPICLICTRASVPEVVDCFYICVVALLGKQHAPFIAGFGGQIVQFPGLWKPNDGTNEFEWHQEPGAHAPKTLMIEKRGWKTFCRAVKRKEKSGNSCATCWFKPSWHGFMWNSCRALWRTPCITVLASQTCHAPLFQGAL
jgi:hypothetical protein